ncbi:Adaptive-response sensory-kinase SasA [anaerobic digester metagenome]
MNFFWKIFFSTIMIASVTFSVGCYYLINSQFRSSLSREISAAYEENDILRYALTQEFKKEYVMSYYSLGQYNLVMDDKQIVEQIAKSTTINTSKGNIPFRLSDSSFQTVFNSTNVDLDNHILKQLDFDKRGYEIVQSGHNYYLHTAGPVTLQGEILYLENFRNIGFLFKNRSEQYTSFQYLLYTMILVGAAVVFLVTHWLTKPLKNLSLATKQIANGHLDQRVEIQSNDEIGKLSNDFNKMAVKLEQTVEELKDASRRQVDFIGSFAHELKTPLTSMIGYADMLRSKRMDQEQIIVSANYIFQEGKRLEALSMKLLEMIVLKKQDFVIKRIFAKSYFDEIIGIMQPVLKNENIDLVTSAEEAILKIEPDLMKTVCFNLLDNARKSIDQSGKIVFSGMWVEDEYQISIEDNGKGMEESELSKITEAFYMVDKSRAKALGGVGLGLAICADIVKIHHARMEFTSSPKKGTRVAIRLEGAKKI